MPLQEKAMENKLIATGGVVAVFLIVLGLLVVGGVV